MVSVGRNTRFGMGEYEMFTGFRAHHGNSIWRSLPFTGEKRFTKVVNNDNIHIVAWDPLQGLANFLGHIANMFKIL